MEDTMEIAHVEAPNGSIAALRDGTASSAFYSAAGGYVALRGPGLLKCVAITVAALGATVSVFDGIDDNGKLLATFDASSSALFELDINVLKGIYVEVTNAPSVLVTSSR